MKKGNSDTNRFKWILIDIDSDDIYTIDKYP